MYIYTTTDIENCANFVFFESELSCMKYRMWHGHTASQRALHFLHADHDLATDARNSTVKSTLYDILPSGCEITLRHCTSLQRIKTHTQKHAVNISAKNELHGLSLNKFFLLVIHQAFTVTKIRIVVLVKTPYSLVTLVATFNPLKTKSVCFI
jgi:hypothetical protein